MKITIYELMGLIKDGKAPKRIEYDNVIYTLSFNRYYSSEEKDYLFDLFNRNFMDTDIPNIKVEILPEENDEWEDIYILDDIKEHHFMNRQNGMTQEDRRLLDSNFKTLRETINQLIKNQKYLKERLDKNE